MSNLLYGRPTADHERVRRPIERRAPNLLFRDDIASGPDFDDCWVAGAAGGMLSVARLRDIEVPR